MNRGKRFDRSSVGEGIVHERDHVEDGRVPAHCFGQGKHQAGNKAEKDTLLCREVGPKEPGKEIVEGLDHARRDLLLGGFVVMAKTLAIEIEDVECGRMLHVFGGNEGEAVCERPAVRIEQRQV